MTVVLRHGRLLTLIEELCLTPTPPLERIQENLIAVQERRLLNWICPRLPAWVTPDKLTILALFGAAMILAGYAGSLFDRNWLWLSVAGYLVHWFGDSLDGSLARYRSIERPRYGYFVDHSADVLGALLILIGLGISPYIRLDVALVALAGYYMLAAHSFLTARVAGELKLTYASAGPTELRIFLIALTVAMYVFGSAGPRFDGLGAFDILVGVIAAILILLFLFHTAAMTRRLGQLGE
jgi:phosphatidylglycerophosphate synthase